MRCRVLYIPQRLKFIVYGCLFLLETLGPLNSYAIPPSTNSQTVPLTILTPAPGYEGWLLDFKTRLFKGGFEDFMISQYEQRIGRFLFMDHPMTTSQDRKNRRIFNMYSMSYVNINAEERGYAEVMKRALVDNFIRTIVSRPSLKKAAEVHKAVEEATTVAVVYRATPTSVPRAFNAKWDLVTYETYLRYSGPEGSFSAEASVSSISKWPHVRPIVNYSFPIPPPYSVSLSYNTDNKSHGVSVGRTFTPTLSASVSMAGNIPRSATEPKEYRTTAQISYTF